MSERYGWTPAQIASLTPVQMQLYLDPDAGKTTRRFGSIAEMRAWKAGLAAGNGT